MLEEDGTEIHNDDYLFSLENHTKLIILEQSDKWMASLPPKGMNNFEVTGKNILVQILILNSIKV